MKFSVFFFLLSMNIDSNISSKNLDKRDNCGCTVRGVIFLRTLEETSKITGVFYSGQAQEAEDLSKHLHLFSI